jgi:hypothetical protein
MPLTWLKLETNCSKWHVIHTMLRNGQLGKQKFGKIQNEDLARLLSNDFKKTFFFTHTTCTLNSVTFPNFTPKQMIKL